MPDVLQLAEGVAVPAPEHGVTLRYSREAADRVLDFFKLLVFAQNRWAGKPFVLQPWQVDMIRTFYGVQVLDDEGNWVRYRRFLYNEIPKKNGKTELAAGLGLYHLLADGEAIPNVGIFAVDRENAETLYKAAKYMVEHTAMGQPPHKPMVYCRDSVREIRTRFGGVMKVYSNDVENKHGPSFSAILADELHAWKGRGGRARWEVLTQGSDAARLQQTVLVLTTAGDDPDRRSIGWEVHEKCRRVLAWRRGEPKPAVECIDIPQGILHMSPPTKELERLIYSHRMRHIHNTCARWCFGNARCYVDANEFQSTPPCGGRPGTSARSVPSFHFNPRPRIRDDNKSTQVVCHTFDENGDFKAATVLLTETLFIHYTFIDKQRRLLNGILL